MELGYDDSNAPTDQGGDIITEQADLIFGNGGDDTIDGEGGDDTIYGDSGSTGGPSREIFQWEDAPNFGDETAAADFTQNTGSVNITFDIVSASAGVDNQYDNGPIILQRSCEVEDDDTAETLAARVFEQECQALPEAIAKLLA